MARISRAIGVFAAEHIAAGLVEENRIAGSIKYFPNATSEVDSLEEMPAEEILDRIDEQIAQLENVEEVEAVGVGFPGIIRDGLIHESPNLPQVKGQDLATALSFKLNQRGLKVRVHVLNDADATSAGIAATRGQLDKLVRVWTLGSGIGFGRYPQAEGVWEGGHIVVTIDPKEHFCRCGGLGHLEGIMGERALRLRFLDLEPEEVFQHASEGDQRCMTFVKVWHRALAAATATSIHMDGPGKFFITGPNAKYVQTGLLDLYVHEMVKMSPLQGSSIEVVRTGDDIAIIGAAVSAKLANQMRDSP
jgi:predicted NBD/HSP70 family sugar kinase